MTEKLLPEIEKEIWDFWLVNTPIAPANQRREADDETNNPGKTDQHLGSETEKNI